MFAAAAAIGLLAAACGSSGGGGSSSTTSASGSGGGTASTVKVKDGGSVTFAIDETIPGFNILTSADNEFVLQEVENQVWPLVFNINADLQPVLNTDLVTSATQTKSNPQTIVYQINPKAVWSDGTPVNADDFIYNWQAQSGLPQYKDVDGQPYDDVSNTGYSQMQSVVGSNNGKTVTVTFKPGQSFGDWKSLFGPIIPAHIAQKVGWNHGFDDVKNVVSDGPYIISNYVKDQTITETPNPKWWGAKPHLSSIVFRILSDDTAGPPAMQNNEVQLFSPASPNKQELDQIKAIPNVTVETPPGLEFEHLDFNQANPYLSNVAVRQAIAYGTDRAAMIARGPAQLAPNTKQLGNRMYVATQPEYVDNGTAYEKVDVAKAKSLLQSAGMTMNADGYFHPSSGPEAGQPLTLTISSTTGNPTRANNEQLFQADMKAIGIQIKIQNYSAKTFFGTNLPKGEYDIAEFAWVDTPFASGNLSIYCSYTNAQMCGQNWVHYSNPTVDKDLTQAVADTNASDGTRLYNEADKQLWTDMVTLPLYQVPQLYAWASNIGNVQANTSNVGLTWNANLWGLKA